MRSLRSDAVRPSGRRRSVAVLKLWVPKRSVPELVELPPRLELARGRSRLDPLLDPLLLLFELNARHLSSLLVAPPELQMLDAVPLE